MQIRQKLLIVYDWDLPFTPSPCPPLSLAQPPASGGLLSYLKSPRAAIGVGQRACGRVESQQVVRADLRPIDKPFVPKGPRTGALEMHLPQQAACILFTPFLPRFHPDGTYQPFLPRFYPGFTPFWRVKCVGVKRRVKTG